MAPCSTGCGAESPWLQKNVEKFHRLCKKPVKPYRDPRSHAQKPDQILVAVCETYIWPHAGALAGYGARLRLSLPVSVSSDDLIASGRTQAGQGFGLTQRAKEP